MKREMTYKELFLLFLKAGFAFGGGFGMLAVYEEELVEKKKLMDRKEFLSLFGIGKIVPSGTVAAMAVGIGYQHKKFPGTLVALAGIMLPGFILTLILTALYSTLRGTELFRVVNLTVFPAALALMVLAALNLGKGIFKSPLLFLFAVTAFVVSLIFAINPAVILLVGGIFSMIFFTFVRKKHDVAL